MWRRVFSILLVLTLTFGTFPVYAQQATPIGFQGLFDVEIALYGEASEGPIVPRLEKAERDVYGRVQDDGSSYMMRVERLAQLLGGSRSGVSLILQLNAIEWMTFQQVTQGQPLVRRIEAVERAFYGEISNAPINERLANLTRALWGSSTIHSARQEIPAETTVRISTITEINSATMKVGDAVRYRVAETVRIDNNIVIPAGVEGVGRVLEVRESGRLGRDGMVTIDWGEIQAIDGTRIKITIGSRAVERNQSADLAAGAAIAGVILLSNPIGLVAGAFITGKDHVMPVGTQFYAEIASPATINALSLVPVR